MLFFSCYCTELEKVLLDLNVKDVEDIFPETLILYTEYTIATRTGLPCNFEKLRESNYTVDDEELCLGNQCFSVPVRVASLNGIVVGAFSDPVPILRLKPEREKEILDALQKYNAELEKKI